MTHDPRTEFLISIGGVVGHFELGAAPGKFIEQLQERYGPYMIPAARWVKRGFSLRVSFAVTAAHVPPEVRANEVAQRPLRVEETARTIGITRWDFSARLLSATASPVTWSGDASCQMNPFAFDSLLRVLWATFLPSFGGALFHSCALRTEGGTGLIFPGESGAGKSTLARKVPEPERILTDELVAVSRGPLGEWRISGTPFWGEFQRGGGSVRSWPLGLLSFLEQGEPLDARAISAAEAAFRLLACLLCFRADADTAARNLAIVIDLCGEVPHVVLRTARDTSLAAIETALHPHQLPPAGHEMPVSAREMISELRWMLRANGRYAFTPRGSSMRPWLRAGESLFVQSIRASDAVAGDILLYWTPGPTGEEDRLICHRMVAKTPSLRGRKTNAPNVRFYLKGDAHSTIERFEDGREAEIFGRVSAVSRDGESVPVPGRVGSLARLLGSLVAAPFLKMAGR
jgi:hypothetical protein